MIISQHQEMKRTMKKLGMINCLKINTRNIPQKKPVNKNSY